MTSRSLAVRWAPFVGAAALWSAAHWPRAVAALPALGLFSGPLGWASIGLAVGGLFLGGLAARLESLCARLSSAASFWLALGVYLAVGLHYAARLHVAGDEPHYLLMAQSLWREGDLDLRDNFARGDFREYVPELDSPHYGVPRRDGRPFPSHSPGLPLLLAPAYALGGRAACVVLMAFLAALLAVEVRRLAEEVTASARAAGFAWLAAAGPPVAVYAFHLYTEVPAALASAIAMRLLLSPPSVAGALGAASAAAALPWLHVRLVPAAALLGVLGLLRLRGRPLFAFLGVAGVGTLAFAGYFQAVFGRPTPLALFGGGVPPGLEPAPVRALAGLFLDRSFGLLPYAPVFVLALAGIRPILGCLAGSGSRAPQADAGRATRKTVLAAHLMLAAALLAPVLAWRMWWGGQCPPARFLVPLAPLFGLCVALRLAAGSERGLARWRFRLVASGYALFAFMAWRPARLLMLNRRNLPTRVWEALAGDVSLERYLPSLVWPDAREERLALVWILGLGALLLWDAVVSKLQARS